MVSGPTEELLALSLQMQQILWLVIGGECWNGGGGRGSESPKNTRMKKGNSDWADYSWKCPSGRATTAHLGTAFGPGPLILLILSLIWE